MRWYEHIATLGGKLQGRERREREIMLLYFGLATIATCLAMPALFFPSPRPLAVAGQMLVLLIFAGALAYMLRGGVISKRAMGVLLVGFSFGIILSDLAIRARWGYVWPMFVLIIDIALVLRIESCIASSIVAAVVCWLCLTSLENTLRFGLYDLPGLPSQQYRRDVLRDMGACQKLPCPEAASTAAANGLASVAVFVLDYLMTRGFADQVLKEQASMQCTIATVEEIATGLAGYDVDTVSGVLDRTHGELPEAMYEALRQLELNLRAYRAYLPKSCMQVAGTDLNTQSDRDTSIPSSLTPGHSPSPQTPTLEVSHRTVGVLTNLKATMMVVNTRGSLRLLHADAGGFASAFTTLLEATLAAVEVHMGMVDVFIGDRIYASFNASRRCIMHATSAAHASKGLVHQMSHAEDQVAQPFNIGLATGRVLCGDMGCNEMRRFSLIGSLAVEVCGVERAGRALGMGAVCNAALHSDAECEHEMRLFPRKVRLVKQTRPVPPSANTPSAGNIDLLLYELVLNDLRSPRGNEEWLYEVGGRTGAWVQYNTAVREYWRDATFDDAVQLAGEKADAFQATMRSSAAAGLREPLVVYV